VIHDPPGSTRWQTFRRAVRRHVLARRRLLAACCLGVAAAAALHEVAGPPPPTVPVTTVVRDLPAGAVLTADDLTTRPLPVEAVPAGASDAAAVVGEVLAAPVRAGEPLTDVRLVGDSLAAAHPDLATMPVRLPDAGQAALLSPGDRIDLVATDPQAGGSRVVAPDALVLAVPQARPDQAATAASPGALVVLGVAPLAVEGVSEAAARWYLSYAFSR
jgi:Flp pilus assembly protein CpaB